jgi:repressor LexA
MARGLTKRQAAILHFIVETIRDEGYPPTIAEIGERFGIASTNGVNDHLLALEKKGYIERSSKARGIHVTEKAAAGLYESGKQEAARLPLLGLVAAGQPVLAIEDVDEYVAVDEALVNDTSYCLRVRGDSMIEDGILEGDVLVVDQAIRPKSGDTVVALIDDEATVKRFYPRNAMVELRPANAAMSSILVPAQDVRVGGVVVALYRRLR